MRAALILLTVVALALVAALFYRHQRAVDQETADQAKIIQLSNDLVRASTQRDELQKVSLLLETNLSIRSQELLGVSNSLIRTAADLEKTRADAKASTEAFQAEMKKRDSRINELEGQNTALEKQSDDLRSAITGLETAIASTEKKLLASEGDREYLLKELKRLQAEKAELERQFNDIAELRKQVSRLKEELSVARRIEWIKRGIFGMTETKGAQALTKNIRPNPGANNGKTNVAAGALQAELRSDGKAVITPPPPANTPPSPAPAPAAPAPEAKPKTNVDPAHPQPPAGPAPAPAPAPAPPQPAPKTADGPQIPALVPASPPPATPKS